MSRSKQSKVTGNCFGLQMLTVSKTVIAVPVHKLMDCKLNPSHRPTVLSTYLARALSSAWVMHCSRSMRRLPAAQ
jgi:hypothetical protein